jgi:hypothetical protein
MIKDNIAHEAVKILSGDRNVDYGSYIESFNKISTVASILAGKPITEEDCAKVLMAVKLVRESHRHKRDNLVDLVAYSVILNDLENENEHTTENRGNVESGNITSDIIN